MSGNLKEFINYIARGISPSYDSKGIIVLNQKCIRNQRVSIEDARIHNIDKKSVSLDKILHNYDVLINSTGVGTLGRVAQIKNIKDKMTVDSHITIVRPNLEKIDGEFFGYCIKTQENFIETLGVGATGQTELSRDAILDNIKIPQYSKTIQQKIAKILSNYDDLIENNNKRIKILAEMAQKIYKEWFVDFKYPGHETATFKETELGKIVMPKKGKNITKATIKEGNIPVVAGGLEPAYYHNTSNTEAPVITVSASGANAGYVKLYYENIWASDCSYIDNKMTPYVYYFYSYLKYNQIDVTNLQKGAAQPHVYPQDLATLKITDINENVIKQFNLIVTPLFEEIRNINLKNKFLKQTKDILLPRLMSGEINVDELEIQ